MSRVYRPQDLARRREKPIPDLEPTPTPRYEPPSSLGELVKEIQLLRGEVEKIKNALRTRGIRVE